MDMSCVYIYNYIYIFNLTGLFSWSGQIVSTCHFAPEKKKKHIVHILNPPWLLYSGNQIEKKTEEKHKQLGMMPFACWKS